jgi:uncharacterized protein YbjT (DUF2867 family)
LTITVIGATGRVGSAVVQRLVTANTAVRVLVRDPGKVQRLLGDSAYLETIRIRLDNPAAVAAGLTGSDAVFLAMGSVGMQASLQRIVIQAAAATRGLRPEPSTWGEHHDLTGPRQVSWPEALQALSAELGETVTFRTTSAIELIQRLTKAGVTPGEAELLVTREWSIIAGENERTTSTVRELTGHEPRTIEEFFHENCEPFR